MSTRAIQIDFLLAGITDSVGNILAGGSVSFFAAGTENTKAVYTEKEKTNPFVIYTLDASGAAHLYGDGIYKVLAYDSLGVLKRTWDMVKIRAHNYAVVSKTATYTVTVDDDVVLVDTSSGHVTLNFPAAASMEYPVMVIHTAGSNNVILDPNSTELIKGASTYTFSSPGTGLIVVSGGAALHISQTIALELADGATVEFANEGVTIQSGDVAYNLILKAGSTLTADRILTITTGDVARTLSMGGNITTTGAFTVSDAVTLKAADIFPATTVMTFGQNAAPTGWTRLTTGDAIYDAATDNAMFCFAKTGNVAQGGAVNPQTAHTHTYNTVIAHNHDITLQVVAGGTTIDTTTGSHTGGGGTPGPSTTNIQSTGSASGTTAANTAPYYIEMMLAKKD